MDIPDYIQEFNQVIVDNPQYFRQITEALWEYWGETPEKWLRDMIKETRVFLITCEGINRKTKKPYKNFKQLMGRHLKMKYEWYDPQGLKTYITNEQEQKHYKNKGK